MQANPRELSWQAIQAIVGVQLSVDVLRFDDMGWHLAHERDDSDVEIIEDESEGETREPPPPPAPSELTEPRDEGPSRGDALALNLEDRPSPPDDDSSPDNNLSIDDYLEVTLSTDSEHSYGCPRCERTFPAEAEREAHACASTPRRRDDDRKHGCHVCVEKFTSYWELRKHINTHFPGMLDSKSSFCHLCQKDYTKTGFMNHLRKHTGERPFVCELCRKAFSQSSSLSIHMKFHLNVRKHACTVCEKKFVTKSELSRHMTVHTKQKSYYCGVCDKAFTRSDNMKKHEKTHG